MSCAAALTTNSAAAAHAHLAASGGPTAAAAQFQKSGRPRRLNSGSPQQQPHCAPSRNAVVTRVVKKGPEPGELSDEEAEYRAMMKQTKEWMAYDPDELPESAPAPWETHIQNLMENGPWPCWDATKPESDFEPEPEFIPFKESPGEYSLFDDKAKIYKKKVTEERAKLTAQRQAEIRAHRWMSMDGDIRLKDIPSCNEDGWTHKKILELINFPEDVERAMEEHSVLRYDPRWPCDNTWIPPPEPDTWEFIKSIGHGTDDPIDEASLGERLAAKNGIVQRFDSEAEGNEFLNQTSEAKLARAIDIGEDDDGEEEVDMEEEEEEEDGEGRDDN